MKLQIESLLIGSCLGLVVGIVMTFAIVIDSLEKQRDIEADMSPTIIWNDYDEAIPLDGELVRIEMIENDTIYICNK